MTTLHQPTLVFRVSREHVPCPCVCCPASGVLEGRVVRWVCPVLPASHLAPIWTQCGNAVDALPYYLPSTNQGENMLCRIWFPAWWVISICCNLQPAVAFLHVVPGSDGRERLLVLRFARHHRNRCSEVDTYIKAVTANKCQACAAETTYIVVSLLKKMGLYLCINNTWWVLVKCVFMRRCFSEETSVEVEDQAVRTVWDTSVSASQLSLSEMWFLVSPRVTFFMTDLLLEVANYWKVL